jgi:hypothetical protein
MRHIAGISIVLFSLALSACGGKGLTKEQCEKVVDKGIELGVKQAGGNVSPEMIEAAKKMAADQIKDGMEKCQKEGTQGEYDCVMKAESIADAEKCGN